MAPPVELASASRARPGRAARARPPGRAAPARRSDRRRPAAGARRPGLRPPGRDRELERQADHRVHGRGRRRLSPCGAERALGRGHDQCWLSTRVPSQSNTISRVMPARHRSKSASRAPGSVRVGLEAEPCEAGAHGSRRAAPSARALPPSGCGSRISRACSISPAGAPVRTGRARRHICDRPWIGVPSSAQWTRSWWVRPVSGCSASQLATLPARATVR